MSKIPKKPPPTPEWESKLGIPQVTDEEVLKYRRERNKLVKNERADRSDASFRSSLSAAAREACTIVSKVRAAEQEGVWNDTSLRSPIFPGMAFAISKGRIKASKLWQIVRRMPKGALLHAHFEAMVEATWLIDQALDTDGMAIVASEPLDNEPALDRATISFRFVGPPSKWSNYGSNCPLWTNTYKPNTPIPALAAASSFPYSTRGRPAFTQWLLTRSTIMPSEAFSHHRGPSNIWAKFRTCFPLLASIIFYEPIFRASIRRVFCELLADGVKWVDFRITFVFSYHRTDQTTPETTYDAMLLAFEDELATFRASSSGSSFWGARFIWTTRRNLPKRGIITDMLSCISHKKRFPALISGYDFVGEEDTGRTLLDLCPEILWFRGRCAEEDLEIPFFFHAGECLGDGNSTDGNLFDAVTLHTRRIGHAFSLYKHPHLIDMIKENNILVEACPISNEVLRLTSSIMSHPVPALLARGVSVALCNDDPAILGHGENGLTHDFWQALQGWDSLGLEGLGSLAENSVRFAAFAPDQGQEAWEKDVSNGIKGKGLRGHRMKQWRVEWEHFCKWVVREFGEHQVDVPMKEGTSSSDEDVVMVGSLEEQILKMRKL